MSGGRENLCSADKRKKNFWDFHVDRNLYKVVGGVGVAKIIINVKHYGKIVEKWASAVNETDWYEAKLGGEWSG